jgi:hypothetical protein
MAGKGLPPTGRAIRGNAAPAFESVKAKRAKQPRLPDVWRDEEMWDGSLEAWVWKRVKLVWASQTRAWWKTWGESSLSTDFTDDDWTFLLDTALLHHAYWQGNHSLAGEIRLRVAKFGQTLEDRQRLKKEFAFEDEPDEKGVPTGQSARARRGPLRLVN